MFPRVYKYNHICFCFQDIKKYIPRNSPDNIDSPIDSCSVSSKDIVEAKSPSTNSVTSTSSSEKDIAKVK